MLTTDRNFWLVLLLSIVTFGIYPLYLISCFAAETNQACNGDGRSTNGLLAYIGLNIITFGIYSIFWSYNWIDRCNNFLMANGQRTHISGVNYILSVFFGYLTLGIWPLYNYAMMIKTQNHVNAIYNGCAY